MSKLFNKSLGTNLAAGTFIIAGVFLDEPLKTPLYNIGLFSLSGAVTNWLAIYMLFDKVPFLYGSGVIPARFEDFKTGINNLVMEEFFTRKNIEDFFKDKNKKKHKEKYDFTNIIEGTDLSPAFDALSDAILESLFGKVLNIIGGKNALEPLKNPFISKVKTAFKEITESDDFQRIIGRNFNYSISTDEVYEKVYRIVEKRLNELTPQMVKEIIQKMIKEHLGWLVIWGGVFGGLIGLITGLLKI